MGGEGGGGRGGDEGAEEEPGEIGAGPDDTGSDSGCSHWLTSV